MTREQVLTLVREHLAEELEVEIEKIDEGTRFKEDLDADSLDLYELVMELEDNYGVTVTEEQATHIKTVGDAVGFVLEHAPGLSRWRPDPDPSVAALAALIDELPEDLRRQALTHSSWTERRVDSFERLAFLGDSVLGLAVATRTFESFEKLAAGGLTKVHNQAVSGVSCAEVGTQLGVPEMLRGERARGPADGDPGRDPARRRPAAAGGDRGADRRLLRRLRLRAHRGGGGRGVRAADRARRRDPDRFQVRSAGAFGPPRRARNLRGDRGDGTPAPANLRGGRDRRLRAGRDGERAEQEGGRADRRRGGIGASWGLIQPSSRPIRPGAFRRCEAVRACI